MDIGELSNQELRDQLIEYGVNCGPIGSSTRLFYEKKLGKIVDAGGVQAPVQQDTEESEEEEEEEEEEVEDEEVQINYRTAPREAPPVQQSRPAAPRHIQTPHTPIIQPRQAAPTSAATRRNVPGQPVPSQTSGPRTSPTQTKSTSGGLSLWLKLLFIVVVAFLVYLVIINMNPSAENKIPMHLDHEDV